MPNQLSHPGAPLQTFLCDLISIICTLLKNHKIIKEKINLPINGQGEQFLCIYLYSFSFHINIRSEIVSYIPFYITESYIIEFLLKLGLATFLCKVPDGNFFRLCMLCGLVATQL